FRKHVRPRCGAIRRFGKRRRRPGHWRRRWGRRYSAAMRAIVRGPKRYAATVAHLNPQEHPPMTVQALKRPSSAASEWRAVLAEIGPRIADEGRRADEANDFVKANFALLREHGFLELGVPVEFGGGGLGFTELSDMLRTLAHYDSATALAFAMHTHGV